MGKEKKDRTGRKELIRKKDWIGEKSKRQEKN